VGAGAFEPDMLAIFRKGVNPEPIGFDMAVTAAGKISTQWVIPIRWGQFFAGNEQIENGFKFIQIVASFAGTLDIFFELRGAAEGPHKPKSV
jgi:hypothetical protein